MGPEEFYQKESFRIAIEEGQKKEINAVYQKLISKSENLEPEYQDIIEEKFWDLI